MTEIQQNRYDQLLRRVADLKGPGSKVNDVLEELFPVIDVEQVPGELLLLGGTRLCMGAALTTADALEVPSAQVFNPVGSGFLITVTDFYVAQLNVSNIRWARTATALTSGIGTEIFRETRLAATESPVGEMRTDSTVALVDANGITRELANRPVHITAKNGLMILAPGQGMSVGSEQIAGQVQVTFYWRERVAEPSELSL